MATLPPPPYELPDNTTPIDLAVSLPSGSTTLALSCQGTVVTNRTVSVLYTTSNPFSVRFTFSGTTAGPIHHTVSGTTVTWGGTSSTLPVGSYDITAADAQGKTVKVRIEASSAPGALKDKPAL